MSETDARQTVAQRQCLSCKQQFDPTEGLTKCPHCELVLTPILTDPLINLVIDGQYKILEDIGHGAVSRVYKGLHLSLNTPIAIKVLKSTKEITPKQLQRFEIEGKAVRSLPNSNIARVYDYGVSPEPYIVMEYVNGKTLAKTISDHGAMPFEKAIPLFITIAEAIDQAHKAGLIHRDLKPSNIMVDAKSGEPKILDFGLVKGFLENVKLTTTGEMVGSPAYMSPEQCRGDRVDQRSDIYSLGCLMFETLTGTAPFDGGSTIEVIFKHLEGEIPDLQKTRPSMHCPPGLQQVLNRTLAKSAEDRYPDMSALCHDLRLVLSGKGKRVAARPRTTTKRGKILRLALAGATALAVALVAIVAMFLSFKQQTQSVVKAAPPLAGNTLKEGMENYLNAYCLKPDARFLFALSDVARYTDGKNVEEIKPVLKPDGWYITVGDDTMHLPRQPGYEELSSCLDEFTKRRVHAAQLKPGTETFTRPAVIDVSTLFDEAKLLENAYARQGMTGALAGAFARDLAWLGIIGYDTIGGLDHLQGRALALAAIAKQLNQNTADVDTLLAWDMGYELAAKRAASLLPKSNAVRAQIFDDKERLEVLASGPDPSGEAKYLRLLNEVALGPESKLFSTQPGQIWESQPAQDLAIAKLDARAKVHFSELLVSREILMESVNRAMQQSNHSRRGGGNGDYATNLKDFLNQVKEDHAGEKDVQPEWIGLSRTEQEMKTFETRLPETTKKFKHNRVLSDDIVRQYYTAFFYSSIFDILKTIEAWYPNDPNATKIFAKSLGKPNNKPGVGNKLNTLVQLKVSPLDPDKYAVFLSNGNTVGAPLLTQAFYQAMDNTNEEDRSRRWSASVDNRPQNLLTLGNIARHNLHDAYLTEQTLKQLSKQSSLLYPTIYTAAREGNVRLLKSIAEGHSVSEEDRQMALKQLVSAKELDQSTITKILEEISSDTGSLDATTRLCDKLCTQNQPKKALSIMQNYIAAHPTSHGHPAIGAQPALATYLMQAGQKEHALAVARMNATAHLPAELMVKNGDVLRDCGDIDAAYKQYEAAFNYYGTTEPFSRMLGVKWRLNQPEQAAKLIYDGHGNLYLPMDWYQLIGEEFVEAHKSNPERIASDFDKLRDGRGWWWGFFEGIPLTYIHHGDYKNGFDLISMMESSNQKQDCRYKIIAYKCLKQLKGEKQAVDWLANSLKSRDSYKDPVWWAISATAYGEYDLLWNLIPPEFHGQNAPTIWDLRATAEMIAPGTAGKYRHLLEQALERTPDCLAGRYCFGDLAEGPLLAIDVSGNPALARRLCIAHGLKSRINGNYSEAAKWYALALQMSQRSTSIDFRDWFLDPPTRFFDAYMLSGKSLGRLSEADFKDEFDFRERPADL